MLELKNKEDRVIQNLGETKTNLVYVAKKGEGKEAITNYKVIKESENYSLVSVSLETGRKNQIRVCFQSLKHPIVGDKKYNSKTNPIRRMGLHANKLVVLHPVTGKEMTFECDIPNSFIKITE